MKTYLLLSSGKIQGVTQPDRITKMYANEIDLTSERHHLRVYK